MSKLPIEYLRHIYDECEFITSSILPDMTKDDLTDNEVLKRAIIRNQGSHIWYTVIAPSGLILREGPNRNTAKLDAIPFGEEVLSCSATNFTETIEGKSGNWTKVTWADKTGYLFNGFLIETNDRKIRLVMPNSGVDSDWECMELPPEIKWEALVDMDTTNSSLRNRNPTHFSSIALKTGKKKVDLDCSPTGFLLRYVAIWTDSGC